MSACTKLAIGLWMAVVLSGPAALAAQVQRQEPPQTGSLSDFHGNPEACPGDPDAAFLDGRVSNPRESRYCQPQYSQSRGMDRLSGPTVSSPHRLVSLTDLAAPKDAKRAYHKAAQEMLKKRPDFARAAQELEKAVRLYPRYAAAWHLLGTARLGLSDPAGARQALQQAIAVNPKYDRPYLFLAMLELNLARFTEAVSAADQALRLNPGLMEVHYYRAIACFHLGQRAAAKESSLAIVRSGEDKLYPWVHTLLGDIHLLEGNLDDATAEYRRLLELEPDTLRAGVVRKGLEELQAHGSKR